MISYLLGLRPYQTRKFEGLIVRNFTIKQYKSCEVKATLGARAKQIVCKLGCLLIRDYLFG